MEVKAAKLVLTPLPATVSSRSSLKTMTSPILDRTIVLSTATQNSSYIVLGRSSHSTRKHLRPASNNAYFDSPNISRHHATIYIDLADDGKLKIRDTGSLHGTFKSGQRVPMDGIELNHGDEIVLGTEMIYGHSLIPELSIRVQYEMTTQSVTLNPVSAPVKGYGIRDLSDSELEQDHEHTVVTVTPQPTVNSEESSSFKEPEFTSIENAADRTSVTETDLTRDDTLVPICETDNVKEVLLANDEVVLVDETIEEPVELLRENSAESTTRKRKRDDDSDDVDHETIQASASSVAVQTYQSNPENGANKRRRTEISLPARSSPMATIGKYAAAAAVGVVVGSVGTFAALLTSTAEQLSQQ
ncbi:hypothetical protein V1512DRAFT_261210 [Lipomyces arxii]|uniref:uncharacterized protein n=1 Tax=Lipomyces arxii TaxID=56418 RepID=UPI0034CE37F6